MKKPYLILSALIIFLALGAGFIFLQKQPDKLSYMKNVSKLMVGKKEENVDYKASFAIFTNGTFRVFTAPMYHNLSEDVFIQADNPNVIRVKKAGTTWDDFFRTLPFKLTKACLTTGTGETFCSGENGQLKFYLNGEKTDNLLEQTIQNGDRALITFGEEDETQIQKQLEQVPAMK